MEFYEEDLSWKKKYLILFWNVQKVQKLVPFSLIEEEFNLILDEALKSVITDALWDNDTISDVTIGLMVLLSHFSRIDRKYQTNQLMTRTQPEA